MEQHLINDLVIQPTDGYEALYMWKINVRVL